MIQCLFWMMSYWRWMFAVRYNAKICLTNLFSLRYMYFIAVFYNECRNSCLLVGQLSLPIREQTLVRIYILCDVSMSKSWLFDNWFVVIIKHKLFTSVFVLMHLPCWQFCHKAVNWKLSLQIPSNFNNVV